MKKRYIVAVICCILLSSICFASCGKTSDHTRSYNPQMESTLESPNKDIVNWKIIDQNYYGIIVCDTTTNVLYYGMSSKTSGLTPLYNADGSLKTLDDIQ